MFAKGSALREVGKGETPAKRAAGTKFSYCPGYPEIPPPRFCVTVHTDLSLRVGDPSVERVNMEQLSVSKSILDISESIPECESLP